MQNSHVGGYVVQPRWFVLSGASLILFVVVLVLAATHVTAPMDRATELQIHRAFGARTMGLFSDISTLGGPTAHTIAVVALTAVLLVLRRFWSVTFFLAVQAGSAAGSVAKIATHRVRPHLFTGAYHASGYSFPSGHALGATLFCGAILYLLWAALDSKAVLVFLSAVSAVCVLLVALSRVVLGVHYPTDVEGGIALGLAWLYATVGVLETRVTAEAREGVRLRRHPSSEPEGREQRAAQG
jgi:undecaprenyl-diphosphatase